jgi:hypothetical protein
LAFKQGTKACPLHPRFPQHKLPALRVPSVVIPADGSALGYSPCSRTPFAAIHGGSSLPPFRPQQFMMLGGKSKTKTKDKDKDKRNNQKKKLKHQYFIS